MLQPVPLKKTISFALTTTFPLVCVKTYVFPESLIMKMLVPRYQRPAISCGTGSPLGQGAAATDALGGAELLTAGAIVGVDDVGVDDVGVPRPHPASIATTKSARASFRMAALSGSRPVRSIVGTTYMQTYVRRSLAPRPPATQAARCERPRRSSLMTIR